jgi:NitT/TauT family transport system substrate-binding protein
MKRFVLSLTFALFLLLSLSLASAQQPTDVTLFMTFIPNVQFAPVYVALEKGYFADEGINIAIEHGDEPVGVNLIAANQRQFGLVSGEQVISARANGLPVVSVYEWFQQYPVGIAYPADGSITSVADLVGRNVGIPGRFGASYSGLIALLAANGLTEQDIDLEEIGFNAPEVMCVGGVEAAVVYINNEPLQINNRAAVGDCGDLASVDVFPVSDYADLVSNGIITNEVTIADNPELVAGMVNAFDRGLRDAISNPAEAYVLSALHVENLPLSPALEEALQVEAAEQNAALAAAPALSREDLAAYRADLLSGLLEQFTPDELTQFQVLLNTIELWDAEALGYADAQSWEMTQDVLMDMGFVSTAIDVNTAFTNQFLPQ